ncbi:MAG: polysaccharide biosynthesis protein, partial [Gammaproteobacteria bacterium]|nr:polysaccharide biosynthesis protein [Gammaproteobacteria bacterium]
MLRSLFELPRTIKKLIVFTNDTIIQISGIYLAMWLITGYLPNFSSQEITFVAPVIIVSSFALTVSGVYKTIHRFLAYKVFIKISAAICLSGFITYFLLTQNNYARPEAIAFIYVLFTAISMTAVRLLIRQIVLSSLSVQKQKVIIYGAGLAGIQLATSLIRGSEYHPVAFVDDAENLKGASISNLTVYSSCEIKELLYKTKATTILLAIPSASRTRRKGILDLLEPLSAEIKTIPGMADIVSGRAKIDELQDVDIDDLLGREPVTPIQKLLSKCIDNQNILITGAGGSIGSELCRQIITQNPRVIVLFELNEFSLYQIEQELTETNQKLGNQVSIIPILGSVQNRSRLKNAIVTFKIDTIYHAAAYKHVPLVEQNVIEGVRNNVFGTLNCAETAALCKVKNFVLISTDKAVRPTNVMGATKRMAELTLQSLANKYSDTMFSMVRFGNVLGSSGSVVPLFKKQLQEGNFLTVTHPSIIRYFMTIPEAALLVIQAGAMAQGGDVFVLDMGKPVLINDLAKKMIRLSGLTVKDDKNPNGDIEIRYTGLRPGEKLYEELLIGGDNISGTDHSRILRAKEFCLEWQELKVIIDQLDIACSEGNANGIRKLLIEAPTGFKPNSDLCDSVYVSNKKINAGD